MPEPRARGLPERWLLPPAPRNGAAAARWGDLPFDRRRALARVGPEQVRALPPGDVEVVAALAHTRLATSWRLVVAAPVLGWLVLMTLWGFGRSTYPDAETWWLAGGLFLGLVVSLAAAGAVRRRLRRTRLILAATARRG